MSKWRRRWSGQSYVVSYQTSALDWGAGATEVVAVPSINASSVNTAVRARGRVIGVTILNVTEAFTDDTKAAGFQVGDGSDVDRYFDVDTTAGQGFAELGIAASTYLLHDGSIRQDINSAPVGTEVASLTFTAVSPTGGTPAGKAQAIVHIAWEFDSVP